MTYFAVCGIIEEPALPSIMRKEVRNMDILSFVASVIASVIAYYICKWLDGDDE